MIHTREQITLNQRPGRRVGQNLVKVVWRNPLTVT
jgi:hypothetical protein